jgi:ABC-type glycerol-3-phosphate transport system permease component
MKRRVSRSSGGDLTLLIFLTLFTAVMMLPLIYAIGHSMKPNDELWLFPPRFFPIRPTFDHYRSLFILIGDTWVPMSRYIFNTVLISVVGTGGHVVIASMAAYPLSRYRFPGSQFAFVVIRASLMFTGAVVGVPAYLIFNTIGLIDTYWAWLLPAFASTLGLYLMKQFMDQMIPMEILESADIDGASEWRKFWALVMPMVKPAWLTLIIFEFRGLWMTGDSVYVYSEELKTLSFALNQITQGGLARAGVGAAVTVIMMIVPLAVFIFAQSNVMETMATSGMKG